MASVRPHPTATPSASLVHAGGSNGDGIDARLRALEIQLARIDERIRGIENTMATKAWVLGGVVAASVIGIGLAITLIKLFG